MISDVTSGMCCVAHADVVAGVNEIVRLWCYKPWESCTLKWTSSRFRDLPPPLFIQSGDGSLTFLANADTLDEYHCQAEEDGYTETVASYKVIASARPRSMRPGAGVEDDWTIGVGSSSSPPQVLCERRSYEGRLAGVALVLAICICFLMSAAILACVRRKSANCREGTSDTQDDKKHDKVSEPRLELRQLPDKQHLTDAPA